MKCKALVPLAGLTALASTAVAVDVSYTFTPNSMILDGNANGLALTFQNVSGFTGITDLTVDLNISGNYIGDLYGYVTKDTGFSVLLNRPGRDASHPYGFYGGGMNITLSDSAASDVHSANNAGGVLTGTYRPDGRAMDPATVVTGDSRSATLSSFNGLAAGGLWTLFLADLAPGAIHTLNSYSFNFQASGNTGGDHVVAPGTVLTSRSDDDFHVNANLDIALGASVVFRSTMPTIGGVQGAGNVAINPGTTLRLGGNNQSRNFQGQFTGGPGGTLRKEGTGSYILNGANTHGATVVREGSLMLATGATLTGAVTVQTNATFGGAGSVLANLTIEKGGTHAPGNSPGTQKVVGDYVNAGRLSL
jgi:autotransporter-associated beta strand protein